MRSLRRRLLSRPKQLLRLAYSTLPFELAVRIARGKPDWAFYIGNRDKRLTINDYLDSFKVTIDTSSDIQRRMLSRTYDTEVLEVIQRYVHEGSVCIDVGANVGAHTLAMAAGAGRSGLIHAIEPGQAFAIRLRENIGLNPTISTRVVVHEVGLSDHEGVAQWQDSPNDPGTASMHWVNPSRKSQTVSVTTLDKLVNDHGFPRLDLIKIDVDGMDHLVIRGAMNTVKKHRPIIVFETTLCDSEQVEAAKGATAALEAAGYRMYQIERGRIEPTRFPKLTMNTLALPESVSAKT